MANSNGTNQSSWGESWRNQHLPSSENSVSQSPYADDDPISNSPGPPRTARETEMQKAAGGIFIEAVAPALIMLLVGSLICFLAEVFYAGQYLGRLQVILGLYVFGSVLVCRISITEGFERALLTGIPLGLVVLIALLRFVTLDGPLAALRFPIFVFFIGFSWWCSSRLVWDCTVLDNSRDTSSRGLLDRMGVSRMIDRFAGDDEAVEIEEDQEIFGATYTDEEMDANQPKTNLIDRIIDRIRRKKNTPGVWVVYFSFAAIPIFGLGQGFIPTNLAGSRQFAFKMFVVYMLAALGLLLVTSLFALQRYLLKRDVSLPNPIAISWVGTGAALIVGTLAAAWLIPRPYPTYSIGESVVKFVAPDNLNPNNWGMGNDGPEGDNASRVNNEKEKSGSQTSSKGKGKSSSGNNKSGKKGSSSGKSNQKSGNKSGKQSGGKSGKQSSGKSGKQSSGSKSKQSGSKQSGSKQSGSKQNGSKNSQSKNSSGQKKDSSGKNSSEKNSGDNKSKSNDSKKGQSNSQQSEQQRREQQNRDLRGEPNQSNSQKQRSSNQSFNQRQSDSKSKQNKNKSLNQKNSSKSSSSSNFNPLQSLGSLFKWIGYLLIAIVVAVLAWIYRKQIAESWKQFLKELQELFDRLFGKKPKTRSTANPNTPSRQPVRHKSFSEFTNPFTTGTFRNISTEDLIALTFQAFEAWARDNRFPREPDQTPDEFARAVGKMQPKIKKGSAKAASLYCQALFSSEEVPREQIQLLARFWEQLEKYDLPAPSPQNTDALTGLAAT